MTGDSSQPPHRTLSFDDNAHLRELVGELGAHLTLIGEALDVDVQQRGNSVTLRGVGADARVEAAAAVLRSLYALIETGHEVHPTDVRHAVRILAEDPGADLASFFKEEVVAAVDGRPIVPRSLGQRRYLELLRERDIVFGVGPAGTGKTYLAMAVAVAALKRGDVKRIVLTRPAVEAGEKLGFLPGDVNEKVDPYLRPLYDALQDMIPTDRVARMLDRQVIEVAPLAFMRGRTLNEAYVVLDEAQNTTSEQMKMFLTRLGHSSRMVITGDVTQIDLQPHRTSGMVEALAILEHVDRVGVSRLGPADVVRHPLVAEIIRAYARARANL